MRAPFHLRPTHLCELFDVLEALAAGKPSPLPEVPILALEGSTYAMCGVTAILRDPRDQQRYHFYLLPEQTVQLSGKNWHHGHQETASP